MAGTLVCLLLGLAGFSLLWWKPGYCLGLILVWAAPALAMQWAYGGGFIWAKREVWLLDVAAPTVYLWVADRLAIGFGIWSISLEHTTGLAPFGLPVEEAVFFATTNLRVVGGLLAYLRLTERLGSGPRRRYRRRKGEGIEAEERHAGLHVRRPRPGRRGREIVRKIARPACRLRALVALSAATSLDDHPTVYILGHFKRDQRRKRT